MRSNNDHLPDFEHPTWLNEKIRWQFLHHRNPLMSLAADKIAVRDYLDFKGAAVRAPELIAFGSAPEDLAATELPARFVLKSSHGSGQVRIVDETPVARAELMRTDRRMGGIRSMAAHGGVALPRCAAALADRGIRARDP